MKNLSIELLKIFKWAIFFVSLWKLKCEDEDYKILGF